MASCASSVDGENSEESFLEKEKYGDEAWKHLKASTLF